MSDSPGSLDRPDGADEQTLLAGTEHATPVFVVDAPEPGPTAVVVGGLHGDEVAGYRAAERVAGWQFGAGTVVVLPRANRVAIERGTRNSPDGNLNRQFPPNGKPTTRLARAIWELVEEYDPDVVLDLHQSQGIYGLHPDRVGQMIFPTDVGDAPAHAEATVSVLNDEVVPWYMPLHAYRRGNVLAGTAPLLVHKVAAALGRPGYLVETTEFLLEVDARVRWEARAAAELLVRHGLVPHGEGVPEEVNGG